MGGGSGEFWQEFPESDGGFIAIDHAGRYAKAQIFPLRSVIDRLHSIEAEEDETRAQGHTLVAIKKRVVATEVKQIRGRDLGNILVR